MTSKKQRGFSLLEMLVTVSIGLIIGGMTFITMMPMLNRNHIDSAYDTTLMVMRNTRHLAITQGHEYIVTFNPGAPYPPGTIEVQFQPPPAVGSTTYPPVQLVNTYAIPTDTSFALQSGFPTGVSKTPSDGLEGAPLAIDFGYTPVGGTGGSNVITFMPDGSARDGTSPSNGGNYSSGVVYLTRPNGVITDSRAISVMGTTGRIRGWRLNVVSGANTWVQQ
jgi:prepilin-type N-terminal cleavage/methylation domain-containing protein